MSNEMSDSVFLIWDNSREVHGEGPTLECIYGNRESAERHVERANEAQDEMDEEDDDKFETNAFTIEERNVIG